MKKNIVMVSFFMVVSAVLCLKQFYIPDTLHSKKYIEKITSYINDEHKREEQKYEGNVECFSDVKTFGSDKSHIYSWINSSCFKANNGKLEETTGYSMAFKFKVEKGEIISYENPKDGNLYDKSMRELFLASVVKRIYDYDYNYTNDVVINKAIDYFKIYKIQNIKVSKNNSGEVEIGEINGRKIFTKNVSVSLNGANLKEVIKKYDIVNALDDYMKIEESIHSVSSLYAKDGGSREYTHINDGYKVVICNKIDGNKNIYFGDNSLEFKC